MTMRNAGMRYGDVSISCVDVPVGVSVRVGEYHATFGVRPIALIASAAFPPSEIARLRRRRESGIRARNRPESERSAYA